MQVPGDDTLTSAAPKLDGTAMLIVVVNQKGRRLDVAIRQAAGKARGFS